MCLIVNSCGTKACLSECEKMAESGVAPPVTPVCSDPVPFFTNCYHAHQHASSLIVIFASSPLVACVYSIFDLFRKTNVRLISNVRRGVGGHRWLQLTKQFGQPNPTCNSWSKLPKSNVRKTGFETPVHCASDKLYQVLSKVDSHTKGKQGGV